jgi:hypothetical protein
MKLLKFFGESDDRFLADVEGLPLRQIDCYRSVVAKYLLTTADGKMLVTGHFLSGGYGVWSIGVALADEGVLLPSWPMEYQIAPCRVPELYTSTKPWRPYSPMLVLTRWSLWMRTLLAFRSRKENNNGVPYSRR